MKLLKEYIPSAIIAVAITVFVALVMTLTSDDVYRGQMTLAVGTSDDVIAAEFGNEAQPIVNTVSQLLRSIVVAEAVVERRKLDVSPEEFLDRLQVTQKPDAAALEITYDAASRGEAVQVLNELVRVYEDRVKQVGADIKLPAKDQGQGAVPRTLKVRARVFDPPYAAADPISPRPIRNLALAFILGLVIAGFRVAMVDATAARRRVRDEERATRRRPAAPAD